MPREPLIPAVAGRFARLAIDCLHREYPNHVVTLVTSDAEVLPPRESTPAFFGCFDWHSAVHGHWTLVRLLRFFPAEAWAGEARSALARSLTPANLAAEVRYLSKPGREGFERPYGLAWLFQLAAELREWDDADGRSFAAAVEPLERICRDRLAAWLPKLTHPIRTGEHGQTAFAMGLALDWARAGRDDEFAALLLERVGTFYGGDVDLPLRFEPSGHDFLSPVLAEADLMRRALTADDFATWLARALPDLGRSAALAPITPSDRADGKFAHLDGLNLSRAWMLDGIAASLPDDDPRRGPIADLAKVHATSGLASVTGEHYAGGHWLGTFATYLTTARGTAA